MNYEEFKTAVLNQMQQLLEPGTTLSLKTICKNNGLKLDGLVISSTNSNVSPTIFLNQYFDKQNAFPDIQAVCRDIQRTYIQNRSAEYIDADFFTDYQSIRSRIAYRLISYEKNKELLETVPYVQYLDLAVVFYCLLNFSSTGNATILIHNSHLKLWHLTPSQLYQQACQTTPHLLPYDFRNIASLLGEYSAGTPAHEGMSDIPSFCPMYVLTNAQKLYGASCILYPGLLEAVSEKLGYDLFILPSSIHEVILLPAENRSSHKELAAMVSQINEAELAADEVLSSQVYYYSKTAQALCICGDNGFHSIS
ncbi:MAG: hypothetical protein K2N87_05310 [Eubacterium sp.]|nr:hypothetical protein [Eubacterium sp.]